MGCVYFIQAKPDGLVKIGFTERDPETRLKELQAHSPVKLALRSTIPHVSYREEQAMHLRFADQHSHGEWFHPHEEMPSIMMGDHKTSSKLRAKDSDESALDAALRMLEEKTHE